MNFQPQSSDLESRLQRLEKQNRRFRQIMGVAFLVPMALIVMAQVPARKSVEANEFILKDGNGNVRMRIGMNSKYAYPQIALLDSKGQAHIEIYASDTNGGVKLTDSKGITRANFGSSDSGASLYDQQFHSRASLGQTDFRSDGGGYLSIDSAGGKGNIQASEEGIDVTDADGFEAILGKTDLVTTRTGEKHTTSVASIMLFDKDRHVMWKAP